MAEDPKDKGIDERQGIQRIKKLTLGGESAGFAEIPKMSGIYFHVFPHCPDFRQSVVPLEINRNSIKSECNAQEGIGPPVEM